MTHCKSCRFSPIPEFDVQYYATHNHDVVTAGVDPFLHFLEFGYREYRDPSAEFSVVFYAQRYLGGDLSQNPFNHYLEHKHEPGIFGRMPDDEVTIPREVKRFTKPGPHFEDPLPLPPSAARQMKVLAYYLPQFHAFPENDRWWGTGFTEWTNIVRGVPRFKGHYQPRVPRDLGFYTLDSNEPFRRQVDMAKASGVHGFIFYYYWFNGQRLLDKPVKRFLEDSSIEMPFCLMWANENWTTTMGRFRERGADLAGLPAGPRRTDGSGIRPTLQGYALHPLAGSAAADDLPPRAHSGHGEHDRAVAEDLSHEVQ